MKFALKKTSPFCNLGTELYILDDIFGESSGHGCGFGVEDIDWYFKTKRKKWRLKIESDGKELEVVCHNADEELPLSEFPAKWKEGLLQVLKKHTKATAKQLREVGLT